MTQQPTPLAVPQEAQPVQRKELQGQLESLMKERVLYSEQLARERPGSLKAAQMERLLPIFDERIRLVEFQLQNLPVNPSEAGTVQPAFMPRAALPPLPNEYVLLGSLLILVAFLPISVAFARRLWRGTASTTHDSRLDDRLADMQGAIDSIAFEVERIGEGQRYVTGLLNAGSKGAPMESIKHLPEAGQKQDYRAITPH